MTRDELHMRIRDVLAERPYSSLDALANAVGDDLWPEVERLQALTAECTCGGSYETYGGPEPDCAVHGAVRALNEAQAEIERLRKVVDVRRDDDTWTVAVEVPVSLPQEMRHDLFMVVTRAVSGWEPDDRDGWDVNVAGYPTSHERDRLAAAERQRDDYRDRYRNQMTAAAELVDKLAAAERERDGARERLQSTRQSLERQLAVVQKIQRERDELRAELARRDADREATDRHYLDRIDDGGQP